MLFTSMVLAFEIWILEFSTFFQSSAGKHDYYFLFTHRLKTFGILIKNAGEDTRAFRNGTETQLILTKTGPNLQLAKELTVLKKLTIRNLFEKNFIVILDKLIMKYSHEALSIFLSRSTRSWKWSLKFPKILFHPVSCYQGKYWP